MGRRAELLEAERNYDLVARPREPRGSFIKSVLRLLFSYLGLVFICALLAAGGALALIQLEIGGETQLYEDKKQAGRNVETSILYLADSFYKFAVDQDTYNLTYSEFQERVNESLYLFTWMVVNASRDFRYDGQVEGWNWSWTFPKALLFTITTMTTIGYGHIFPKTSTGQAFCVVYSLVSIGITLVMLTMVGSGLAKALVYTYSRLCCRWFRSRRVKSEIPSRAQRHQLRRRLIDEVVGEEPFMPTDTIPIPIIVNILIICSYIAIGAFVFSDWEQWTLLQAAYFSFITLFTIGLGDLVPLKSFSGISTNASSTDIFKFLFATLYCAVGLALISMCISLIQEQAARSTSAAIGKKKNELVQMDVVQIKTRKLDWGTENEANGSEEQNAGEASSPSQLRIVQTHSDHNDSDESDNDNDDSRSDSPGRLTNQPEKS